MKKITTPFVIVLSMTLASFFTSASAKESIVTIETTNGTLEGSLLKPESQNSDTIALIIAGSGPTDRDGNNPSMTNNSLKLLAQALAENGISSIRYDKRGVGGSTGAKIDEVNLRFEHYINDAKAWLKHIRKVSNYSSVIVIGHSEGALIGALLSQQKGVDKFVSIAGAGKPADQVIREQLKGQPEFVKKQANTIMDELLQERTVDDIPNYLQSLYRASVQPYLISWFKYSPQTEIAKVSGPVLVVQGKTDIQVSVQQAELLADANPKAKLVLVEGMNHVLKAAPEDKMQNMQTYNQPTLPIHPNLVTQIVSFINH